VRFAEDHATASPDEHLAAFPPGATDDRELSVAQLGGEIA